MDAAHVARRLDVSAWHVIEPEPSGDDEKLWLRDEQGASWLWKPVTAKDGRRQGEDWAELLVHVVAESMGVPTAQVRLARRGAADGLVSRDVKPNGFVEAHHGSVLLQSLVDDYDRRGRDRRGHTIENVARVLDGVDPPADDRCAGLDGYGVFVGYLVLDALVAGQDRHSDNWFMIVMPDGSRRLMHSYDHATSLGFNLTVSEVTRTFVVEILERNRGRLLDKF